MTQSPFRGNTSPSGPTGASSYQSSPSTATSSSSANSGTDFGATTISNATGPNGPVAPGGPGAPPVGPQRPAAPAQANPSRARNRGPRRARLQLRHISPLTVLKFSCVLAIALFFVWLIVVGVLYGVLDAAGVIQNVNDTVVKINGAGSKPPVTSGIVFGGAAIIGVVNIVLFVALTTIGSVIYNLCADLVGGVEITLSER